MGYLTRQQVRTEAGFQDVENPATLSGVADGSNAVFATPSRPIVDRTNDDSLTLDDVTVFVDGIPVEVSDVDFTTGLITLAEAPASDSEVSAWYATSPLTDDQVDEWIEEAEAIVNKELGNVVPVPLSVEDTDNYLVARRIAKLYAAGFALTRDYGKNVDTEETSKDGYAKLAEAKKLLTQLVGTLQTTSDSKVAGNVKVYHEGSIFNREHCSKNSHDHFMRKNCN